MNELERLNKIISENIRIRRLAENMTQEELSEKAGLAKTTIYEIEKGKEQNLGLQNIVSIAKALDINAEELFFPNDVLKHYCGDLKEYKDYECERLINTSLAVRTYFPPLHSNKMITSFVELLYALPLLNQVDFYDILLRIDGDLFDVNCRSLEYASELFDRAFNNLPDSPEKRFVESEMEAIRRRREGIDDEDDYKLVMPGDERLLNYNAYSKMLEKKCEELRKLRSLKINELFKSETKLEGEEKLEI